MDSTDPRQVALRFNDAINQRDLEALAALMTEDHAFVDSSGDVERGKATMKEAWKSFFQAYPDYRNIFERVETQDDIVVMRGYSICSNEPVLDGPALWSARVNDGLVSEWRVYADTPEQRQALGLD